MLPLPTSNDTLFSKNGTEAPKAKHSVPRPYYGLFAGDSRRVWATTLDSQGGERRAAGSTASQLCIPSTASFTGGPGGQPRDGGWRTLCPAAVGLMLSFCQAVPERLSMPDAAPSALWLYCHRRRLSPN